MTTDPMLESSGTLSINRFTGNGSQTSWDINFAGGYLRTTDVKAYTVDSGGAVTIVSLAFDGPNTVTITPAVAAGVALVIYRDTPKDEPVVDFTDGAIVNEANLDKMAKQAVFTSAEMVDRFGVVSDLAEDAITKADQAIAIAGATVGGDFTSFAKIDTPATWSAAQVFAVGCSLPTPTAGDSSTKISTTAFVATALANALTAYVTTAALSTALGSYTATTAMNTAISAAAATAQANAIATAATDATNKDTVVKAQMTALAIAFAVAL